MLYFWWVPLSSSGFHLASTNEQQTTLTNIINIVGEQGRRSIYPITKEFSHHPSSETARFEDVVEAPRPIIDDTCPTAAGSLALVTGCSGVDLSPVDPSPAPVTEGEVEVPPVWIPLPLARRLRPKTVLSRGGHITNRNCTFCHVRDGLERREEVFRTDKVFVIRGEKDRETKFGHFLVNPLCHTEPHDYDEDMLLHMHAVGIVVAAGELLKQQLFSSLDDFRSRR